MPPTPKPNIPCANGQYNTSAKRACCCEAKKELWKPVSTPFQLFKYIYLVIYLSHGHLRAKSAFAMYFGASLILRVVNCYIGPVVWSEGREECDAIIVMIMNSSAMEDLLLRRCFT